MLDVCCIIWYMHDACSAPSSVYTISCLSQCCYLTLLDSTFYFLYRYFLSACTKCNHYCLNVLTYPMRVIEFNKLQTSNLWNLEKLLEIHLKIFLLHNLGMKGQISRSNVNFDGSYRQNTCISLFLLGRTLRIVIFSDLSLTFDLNI